MSSDVIAAFIGLAGAIFGTIIGSLVTGIIWWKSEQRNIERELLSDGLKFQALQEGWILEGPDYHNKKLSELGNLPEKPVAGGLWLRKVEVRAVLDQQRWNRPPTSHFYRFIDGRRTWIVRDQVVNELSFPTYVPGNYLNPHPAILSSEALEEIAGWIERVASAYEGRWIFRRLSPNGVRVLYPILNAVADQDRTEYLSGMISPKAHEFLNWYRKKHLEPFKRTMMSA